MDLLKQIEELSDKALMYEHLRIRYLDAVKKLDEAKALMDEAIKILDPVHSVKHRDGTRTYTKHSDKLEEQYNKMRMGLCVSTDSLGEEYPELTHSQIMGLYMKISKGPKVLTRRRDDNRRELYIQKEG